MSNAFAPMTADGRQRFRAAYLAYLHVRDGVPDVRTNRFDIREKFFAEIDATPTRWEGAKPVTQEEFDRNHAKLEPDAGLNETAMWALATAKTNRAEAYGVEYSVEHDGPAKVPAADLHTYIATEEFYHTRILKDALATIGLESEVSQPSWSTRILVRAMVLLPDAIANMFVLCGEIVGVAIFGLLLEKARVLFKSQPAVLERLEALFGQIMVDEVGHVHFVRSTLGPVRLALSKLMLPIVAWGALRDLREVDVLFGRKQIMERVVAADVDAAAAPYPDRFVLPAV